MRCYAFCTAITLALCLPVATPRAQHVSITQSTSLQVASGNSTSCNSGAPAFLHSDNHFFRAIPLSQFGATLDLPQLRVLAVDIGIERADAAGTGTSQPLTLRLHRSTTLPPTLASLVPLSEDTVPVTDRIQQMLRVDLAAPQDFDVASDVLVVEVFTPSGQGAGHRLVVGSNALGQAGPSYILAPDCSVGDITNLAAIGFPTMHLVMRIHGYKQIDGPSANLSISKSDGLDSALPGATLTWTVTARNDGIATTVGARVTDVMPEACEAVAWTCMADAGASCGGSGLGDIDDAVVLAPGTQLAYSIDCSLDPSWPIDVAVSNTARLRADNDAPGGPREATDATLVVPDRILRDGFEPQS